MHIILQCQKQKFVDSLYIYIKNKNLLMFIIVSSLENKINQRNIFFEFIKKYYEFKLSNLNNEILYKNIRV